MDAHACTDTESSHAVEMSVRGGSKLAAACTCQCRSSRMAMMFRISPPTDAAQIAVTEMRIDRGMQASVHGAVGVHKRRSAVAFVCFTVLKPSHVCVTTFELRKIMSCCSPVGATDNQIRRDRHNCVHRQRKVDARAAAGAQPREGRHVDANQSGSGVQ